MDFSVEPISLTSDFIDVDYFLVPWDSEIFGFNVGQISNIEIRNSDRALRQFKIFQEWLDREEIELCGCRLQHDQLNEVDFLQKNNFRFIELNYCPTYRIGNPTASPLEYEDERLFKVSKATDDDRSDLISMAAKVFRHGRFHQDTFVCSLAADKRYSLWMKNSFSHPDQVVYKCTLRRKIVAFFVVEYRQPDLCHWGLVGLAPNLGGKGLGTKVWKSMIRFHQYEGVKTITTSISSHNSAVFNLYVKLGFRFPMPATTLHWHKC